ncbi:MAG: peroxiredoxin-like family protein [Smithellaceae bacterium]|nr:peroxiredoxin-like family protein [Smithellaceae bacterium]
MYSKMTIGDKAPDFKFQTPWDDEANFYDAVGNHPAVLFFLRYYGCPVCRMEMAIIKQEIDLVRQKRGRVFVVLQSAPETIASLIKRDDFPFTIICDAQGKVFKRYGVEAGGLIRYLHPAGLFAAIKAIGRGFRHGKFEGKETQLPAAFAMTAEKVVTYAHYGKNIGDIPSLTVMTTGL